MPSTSHPLAILRSHHTTGTLELRPNLFIVGAAKAGTTFLHGALSRHPEIAMSRPKEPGFFSDGDFRRTPMSAEEYLGIFPVNPRARVIGEASVDYLYSRSSATRILAFNPNARILISLRNPADVIISLHRNLVLHGHQSEPDLARALALAVNQPRDAYPWLRYYDAVRYSDQVPRYLDAFGDHQLRIILFDDLVRSPDSVIGEIVTWLGLSKAPDLTRVPRNTRHDPRSPRLARWLRQPPTFVLAAGRALPQGARRALASRVNRLNRRSASSIDGDEWIRQRLAHDLEPEVSRLEALLHKELADWRV
jgi:hypothetical protein